MRTVSSKRGCGVAGKITRRSRLLKRLSSAQENDARRIYVPRSAKHRIDVRWMRRNDYFGVLSRVQLGGHLHD